MNASSDTLPPHVSTTELDFDDDGDENNCGALFFFIKIIQRKALWLKALMNLPKCYLYVFKSGDCPAPVHLSCTSI